jgi:hypothetical protein
MGRGSAGVNKSGKGTTELSTSHSRGTQSRPGYSERGVCTVNSVSPATRAPGVFGAGYPGFTLGATLSPAVAGLRGEAEECAIATLLFRGSSFLYGRHCRSFEPLRGSYTGTGPERLVWGEDDEL